MSTVVRESNGIPSECHMLKIVENVGRSRIYIFNGGWSCHIKLFGCGVVHCLLLITTCMLSQAIILTTIMGAGFFIMATVGYKKLPLLLTSIPSVLEIIEPMVIMASLFFFCTGYLPTVYCILRTIKKSKHCNYIIFGISILVQDSLAYIFIFHSGHPPLIAFALS